MQRWIILSVFLPALLLQGCDQEPASFDPQIITENNRAVGLMGRYEYEKAVDVWADLVAANPDWLDGQVNLALATLNRQQENDEPLAGGILTDVLSRDSSNVRAQYLMGILEQRAGRNDNAINHFMAVISLDPDDAYGWYYYGVVNEEKEPTTALLAYKSAVRLNPYLRSGWYRLGQIAARLGDEPLAEEALGIFQKLEDNPRGTMVKPVYGRLGPNALAATIDRSSTTTATPTGSPWNAPESMSSDLTTWRTETGSRVPNAVDLDRDGDVDLFIAGVISGNAPNAVLINQDGTFTLAEDHPLASVPNVQCAMFGDLDHDGAVDAYLGRRGTNVLMTRGEDGEWIDVTATAEVGGGELDTRDGVMVDIDHDGDLDLLLANADGPMHAFANTLNGAFRDISEDTGMAAATNATRLLVADLDRTKDLDVLAIRPGGPNLIFLNDRLWTFERSDPFAPIEQSNMVHAISADLEADGWPELITVEEDGTVGEWWFDNKKRAKRKILQELTAMPSNIAAMDVDGDGVLELVSDSDVGLTNMQSWTPALLDLERGMSIVAVPAEGAATPIVVAPGPGRFPFTAVTLAGAEDATQQMRSNADGIGALVAARRGTEWTISRNLRTSGGPGQNQQPMAFGLGAGKSLDFVFIDWPDGLLQTELAGVADAGPDAVAPAFSAGALDRIPETQRQVSSCPVLFTFDGEEMRFVSDVLGVGGIGFLLEPGTYNTSRPWERFPVPQGVLAPTSEGRLEMVLCEPMEEVCYLDSARLIGWELPEGWQLAIDERMAIMGPQPSGKTLFYSEEIDPISARNDRNENVLNDIITADGRAAAVGTLDRRFIGRLMGEHVLEFTFDADLSKLDDPWLLMDGWIEYPYSQTMFASWQADATYDAPTLEARVGNGEWQVVQEQFGYPAGMPRTAAYPLDAIPEGTDALRLRSNQEIYWDRLRVIDARPAPAEARRFEARLKNAEFSAIGFPHRLHLPQRRPGYDFGDRVPLWDVRHQRGLYTEFGEVADLVSEPDERIVTIGPGEGVHLSFALPEGESPKNVSWLLDLHGWCKDRDRFTNTGYTLEPLPAEAPRANRMESGY